jgi:hypothetical protein
MNINSAMMARMMRIVYSMGFGYHSRSGSKPVLVLGASIGLRRGRATDAGAP